MSANAALYLPEEHIELNDIFKSSVVNQVDGKSFNLILGDDLVTYNIMPKIDIKEHILGLINYLYSLNEEKNRIEDAIQIIKHTKTVLGLVAEKEFDENPKIWESLFKIADKYNGYVFVYESLLLPNGGVILGPLKKEKLFGSR